MKKTLSFLAGLVLIGIGLAYPQEYNAQFVSQNIPGTMTVGFSYPITIKFTNTGTETWTAANAIRLGSDNPQNNWTWGIARVELGASVQPGQTKIFRFSVTAPATPGTYDFQWCLLQEGVTWFGQSSANVRVNVQPRSEYDNRFEFKQIPATCVAGESFKIELKFKNVGSRAWTAANLVKLGSDNPQNNLTWGIGRVELGAAEVVNPDQSKTFVFVVTAPSVPGKYNCQWCMLQEGVTWFGQSSSNTVIVVKAREEYAARFVSQVVPLNMAAGGLYQVSVAFKNLGAKSWTATDGVKLGSLIDAPWGITRVDLSPSEVIGFNQVKVFEFNVTAPPAVGLFNMQWQMMKEYVKMFGEVSPQLTVNVQEDIVDPINYLRGTPGKGFLTDGGSGMMAYQEDAVNRKFWYMKIPEKGKRWERFGWDNQFIYLERDTTWPPEDGRTEDGKINTAYDCAPYGSMRIAPCYGWRVGDAFRCTTRIKGFNFEIWNEDPASLCDYNWAPKGWLWTVERKLFAHYPHYKLSNALKDVDVIVIELKSIEPANNSRERHWYAKGLGFVRWQKLEGETVIETVTSTRIAPAVPKVINVCPGLQPVEGK